MIRFAHAGLWQDLGPGQSWSLPPVAGAYRDAPEAVLLDLIHEIRSGRPWREVVTQRFATANPWLCRIVTSPSRDLFARLHPPAPESLVLDVGAGWGQWALPLAASGHRVVALEPTPERLDFIREAAAQEGLTSAMAFVQASLADVGFERVFDLVCCIGVLEWVPRFSEGEPRALQVDFLRRMASALRPGGRLVVGIENRLGLKYLLGARDDHTGTRGISVLDAEEASRRHLAATGSPLRCLTYSLPEYEALFAEAGLSGFRAHAAWPDYKLPALILPVDGDLDQALLSALPMAEHDGHDGSVLPADTQAALHSHYRSLAALRCAGGFAPSYFLEGFV